MNSPDAALAGLDAVLQAYGASGAVATPLGAGLINQTYDVQGGIHGHFVLQRLHPIFRAEVNEDIDAVTRHLEARGLVTPRLLPTTTGELWTEAAGGIWRAQSWVDGVALDQLEDPEQARQAGAVLAAFHHGVSDLRHEFRNARLGVHDTARHLANLRQALVTHRSHPRFDQVEPLARQILSAAEALPPMPSLPERIVHGDPKLNNILFGRDGAKAICLIDLDTLTHMPLPLELGDAFRSWCNPAGEDLSRAWFSMDLFEAGIAGYAAGAGGFVSPAEWRQIVPATETIYVELAARFCADALNECYFGWNPRGFPGRSEHNQVRAESQLQAAKSLAGQRAAAEAAVKAAFTG